MPRSLVSYWKRVATSGPTTDGREILPQELRDIAETYKPSLYTAVIWCEHERWQGTYGTVFAVRLIEEDEDLEPGQVALEAQLKPNDRLPALNDQGQKLFSSIEIYPNFRGKGKAYMTGMAVTDEPASTGTQELYFSNKTSKRAYYAASVLMDPATDAEPQGEMKKFFAMFTGALKRFAADESSTETSPQTQNESKPPMDEATAKALQALIEQQLIVTSGMQALIDSFAEVAPDPEPEPIEDVQTAVDDIVTTAEEEKNFNRNNSGNKAVLAGMAKLQKQFSALMNTPQGRNVPRSTGPADPKKRVL